MEINISKIKIKIEPKSPIKEIKKMLCRSFSFKFLIKSNLFNSSLG
jgi:hypothetical protein